MNTKARMSKMVYELRDRGIIDLDCKETGANWNSDKHDNFVMELLTLRRLINKHHRLAEFDCNGVGYIRGNVYYSGMSFGDKPDAYEIREYGYGVKSAYLSKDSEETIFDIESEKVADKIKGICERLALRVEFQGDPRGYTVKIYKGDRFLDIQGI